jgi:hypothetical protein
MFLPLSKDSYFIEMTYVFNPKNDSRLDFILDHLRINLCLPYVLKLYQMTMEALGTNTNNKQEANSPVKPNIIKKVKNQSNVGDESEDKEIQNSSEPKSLKVCGKIKLPEVILFAEPEKFNSKILFMNVSLVY